MQLYTTHTRCRHWGHQYNVDCCLLLLTLLTVFVVTRDYCVRERLQQAPRRLKFADFLFAHTHIRMGTNGEGKAVIVIIDGKIGQVASRAGVEQRG